MPLRLEPTTYLITDGLTTQATTPSSEEFRALLSLAARAVEARVSLIQLREKLLPSRVLYELTRRALALTRGTETRLLVNDRADIALAACADGVHLTTRSLDTAVVRRMATAALTRKSDDAQDASARATDFLIGVSAHNLAEARAARDGGADFATFGPIFDTPSKRPYGPPVGLDKLKEAAQALAPFPLLALGGLTLENAADALRAGARGVAAIRLFTAAPDLSEVVRQIQSLQRSL